MNQEQMTEYIVKELGKNRNPQDVIMFLCESEKLSWPEAEKLVRQVYSSRRREIATRQSPLLIFFCVGLLLLGIGGIILGAVGIMDGDGSRSDGRYLLTGIGMLLGGIIGLWNTIASILKIK